MQEVAKKLTEINQFLTSTSCGEYCEVHPTNELILIEEIPVCPTCFLNADTERLKEEVRQNLAVSETLVKYNTLETKSICSDKTLLQANFKSFIANSVKQKADLESIVSVTKEIKNGTVMNLWLIGEPGVGKSHLAMSMLKYLNQSKEHRCCFISLNRMLKLIRESFNDRESKYTENYFMRLIGDVDYLVIDDIGAETGRIGTDKEASDWTISMLMDISEIRQDKTTIYTTNLSSEQLFQVYDKKTVSRMLRNKKLIIFENDSDYRISDCGF